MTHYPGQLGWTCKLYVTISSVKTEIPIVGDVKIPLKHSEVAADSREGGGFNNWVAGLTEVGCTFFLQKRKGHACYNAIRDAWRSKAVLVIDVADGPIATVGTDAVTASLQVFDFSEEQNLNGVVGHTVTMKPTWAETPPSHHTISS